MGMSGARLRRSGRAGPARNASTRLDSGKSEAGADRKIIVSLVSVASPMHYQFLFTTRRPKESPNRTAQRDPGEDAYGFLRQTCADAIAAGRLRPEFTDADEVAQIAWGAMHGLVELHIAKVDDPWIPWRNVTETAARACDALLRGLVREPET